MNTSMPNCTILVATHKPYWMPSSACYVPLQVGSAGRPSFGFMRDDCGESISEKNPWYCELTGMYWAWKNIRADYIGLVHYRRFFTRSAWVFGTEGKRKAILDSQEWERLLQQHPLILPKCRHYFITTRRNQFITSHGPEGLTCTEEAMERLFPEYLPAYQAVMARTWGHICNMFVMRRDLYDNYCAWLFPLLEDVEAEIYRRSGSVPPRLLGFIAERLLDVWLEQKVLPYKEIAYTSIEPVNWPVKVTAFMKRALKATSR